MVIELNSARKLLWKINSDPAMAWKDAAYRFNYLYKEILATFDMTDLDILYACDDNLRMEYPLEADSPSLLGPMMKPTQIGTWNSLTVSCAKSGQQFEA